MREGQRQLIDGQGRDRAGLTHQCRFRSSARYDLDRFRYASDLPTKQGPFGIKWHFDRPATLFGVARGVDAAAGDRPSLSYPPKEAAGAQIPIQVVQSKELCLPFRSIEAARMASLWSGVKW